MEHECLSSANTFNNASNGTLSGCIYFQMIYPKHTQIMSANPECIWIYISYLVLRKIFLDFSFKYALRPKVYNEFIQTLDKENEITFFV
jgi:hypothetical protein